MEEIDAVKRLMSLSEDEIRELDEHESDYLESAKKLVKSYDSFEKETVKAGRLKTLLGNVTYKVNFSYNELFRTANQIREELKQASKNGVKIGESLSKKIEEFLSENSERKELSS
ncbi:hypothetical protein IX51_06070 [uncultured archaeon]|nr:hypothetical protein IX51_06070 [uncultured archaeon]